MFAHPVWGILCMLLASIVGGYAFTYAFTAALARLLPIANYDAVMISTLLSFAVYTVFVIWIFAEQTVWKRIAGLALTAPLAVIGFWPQLVGALV